MNEFEIWYQLIFNSKIDKLFSYEVPEEVFKLISAAQQTVATVEKSITGPFSEYFNTSKQRYANYVAAISSQLPIGSQILDVGNAPGHVGMCLHELGFSITGVNLNSEWRKTYVHPKWLDTFSVLECDIEKEVLPFRNDVFDGILFTEVLEHVAIMDPLKILEELYRVLRPGGVIVFSTPNVCNISNIYALLNGKNVFWEPSMFYGSYDRHNREYTPAEVVKLFGQVKFQALNLWGINDHSNWRGGGNNFAYSFIEQFGDNHTLLRNTIVGVFKK